MVLPRPVPAVTGAHPYRMELDCTMSSTTLDLEISLERKVCGGMGGSGQCGQVTNQASAQLQAIRGPSFLLRPAAMDS